MTYNFTTLQEYRKSYPLDDRAISPLDNKRKHAEQHKLSPSPVGRTRRRITEKPPQRQQDDDTLGKRKYELLVDKLKKTEEEQKKKIADLKEELKAKQALLTTKQSQLTKTQQAYEEQQQKTLDAQVKLNKADAKKPLRSNLMEQRSYSSASIAQSITDSSVTITKSIEALGQMILNPVSHEMDKLKEDNIVYSTKLELLQTQREHEQKQQKETQEREDKIRSESQKNANDERSKWFDLMKTLHRPT